MMAVAAMDAFSASMCPSRCRREMMMGMDPKISITANRTMVADTI